MGRSTFGKHELIAELGHGGMADVFLAVPAERPVSGYRKLTVIKRLRSDLLDDPEFVTMLIDEARIAARLNHPNVVQTTDVGATGDRHFIEMEYLDGQPLHRIQVRATKAIKAGKPPPLSREQYYLILMDVLAGLHHAHELTDFDGTPLHIVHRDVTPQNIFVTYEGQVKVVDFGIAKAANRAAETRQGIVKGKIRYMAPEQAIGLAVTRRADIFAVGILLWEAATGRRLWADKDELEIIKSLIANDMPPMPQEIDPTVPDAIDRIVRKALATRTEERYATADAFRADLEEYLASVDMLIEPRRRLGPAVAELFKDKREQMRALIESQLAKLDGAPVSAGPPRLRADSRADSSSGGTVLLAVTPPPFSLPPDPRSSAHFKAANPLFPTPATLPSLPTTTLPVATPLPRRSRMHRFVLGAIAGGALFVASILVVLWRLSPATAQSTTETTARPPPVAVAIRVSAMPEEARVRVDDAPPQPVPFERTFPTDRKVHRITVEADGYEPRIEEVTFTHDVRMALELVATAPPASAKPASARPSPPKPTTANATATPGPAPKRGPTHPEPGSR